MERHHYAPRKLGERLQHGRGTNVAVAEEHVSLLSQGYFRLSDAASQRLMRPEG
jgi:hypothetical protein